MLKEGTQAPDFDAEMAGGERFQLSSFRGQKHVVLYFYPKDFTPGCTKEACSFRDNYSQVEEHDAVIVGVSNDSAESHDSFRERHELPFPLVPDPGKRLIKLYEADGFLGMTTARITYVIDKEGTIRKAFRHDFAIGRHLDDTLNALRSLSVPAA